MLVSSWDGNDGMNPSEKQLFILGMVLGSFVGGIFGFFTCRLLVFLIQGV